jgi:hypothetical protein
MPTLAILLYSATDFRRIRVVSHAQNAGVGIAVGYWVSLTAQQLSRLQNRLPLCTAIQGKKMLVRFSATW